MLVVVVVVVVVSDGLWHPRVNPRAPYIRKLLSTIPYVGGRKVRRMLAGGYLGRTQWSELAILRRDLNVSRQWMGWYDLWKAKANVNYILVTFNYSSNYKCNCK